MHYIMILLSFLFQCCLATYYTAWNLPFCTIPSKRKIINVSNANGSKEDQNKENNSTHVHIRVCDFICEFYCDHIYFICYCYYYFLHLISIVSAQLFLDKFFHVTCTTVKIWHHRLVLSFLQVQRINLNSTPFQYSTQTTQNY